MKKVAWTMMDVFIKATGEKKVYTVKERVITVQSGFFFENYYVIGTETESVYSTCTVMGVYRNLRTNTPQKQLKNL